MTLVDAGPLVGLIDKGQGEIHHKCVAAAQALVGPLVTTWACFAEAMYLLGRLRGWEGQRALWSYVLTGALILQSPATDEIERMESLMEKYQDTPMDLADASLVAAAESLGLNHIFTLDSDFYVYRIHDKDPFIVVPT